MSCIDLERIDFNDSQNKNLLPVGISNRHIHLSQEHLEVLFGKGAALTEVKPLSQPGQFATAQLLTVVGPKGCIPKVRVLGPVRPQTQVELAQTDARQSGIKAPVRVSGDLAGSAGCVLVGPEGYVLLEEGVIVALPHLHLHTSQGEALGIKDKDRVDLYFKGVKKGAIFDIIARVNDGGEMDFHIDTDEANAFQVAPGQKVLVVKRA